MPEATVPEATVPEATPTVAADRAQPVDAAQTAIASCELLPTATEGFAEPADVAQTAIASCGPLPTATEGSGQLSASAKHTSTAASESQPTAATEGFALPAGTELTPTASAEPRSPATATHGFALPTGAELAPVAQSEPLALATATAGFALPAGHTPQDLAAPLVAGNLGPSPTDESLAEWGAAPLASSQAAAPLFADAVEGVRAVSQPSFLRRWFLMESQLAQAKVERFAPEQPGFAQFRLGQGAYRGARALYEQGHVDSPLLLLKTALRLGLSAAVAKAEAKPHPEEGGGGADQVGETDWASFSMTATARALQASSIKPALIEAAREAVQTDPCTTATLPRRSRKGELAALLAVTRFVFEDLERQALSVASVRWSRALRLGALLALLMLPIIAGWVVLHWRVRGHNLAFGKPVAVSSNHDSQRFPAAGLTDGVYDKIGMHTKREQNPWVRIDLGAPMEIHRVVVTNREDKQARAVPLVIEVGSDGRTYQPFAAPQAQVFATWTAEGRATARYVRLRALKRTELHLNEVEVY